MARSKRQRIQDARKRLALAQKQWDEAVTDSWEPAEPADCVTKAFYAFENALMAAVVVTGGPRTQRHYEKADLALKLHRDHGLRDISDRLNELNDLRKDVSYGEPGDDLREVDLEDLVSELESFIEEVERLISAQEKAS
jgi:hypothetical protein